MAVSTYIPTSKYVATHSSYSMYFIMYMYLKLEVSVLVPRYYVLLGYLMSNVNMFVVLFLGNHKHATATTTNFNNKEEVYVIV